MTRSTSIFGLQRRCRAFNARALGLWVASAACLLPALGQAQTVSYSAPIVITKGGTYTGNYQSLASGVPCVIVNTTEAVVLEGCNFSGAGNLIQSGTGADLTVRDCRGQGLAPTADDRAPGRFVDAYRPKRLVVEHNELAQTGGIGVNRWGGEGAAGQTLTVRYNRARNIDGRYRNGGGARASFLLLNTVQHLAGVEVAYNEVLNAADQSLVEDNFNLYNTSGTAQSPVRVHDNFVRGAYPVPATGGPFTGSGMTTDGDARTASEATAYVEADHNQFVSTGNAAMNIAAGHDVYYHDNRCVSSGFLADGRRFTAGFVGLGVFNYYQQPADVFFNNRVANNTVGFVRWGGHDPFPDRQDEAPDACATCTGTVHLPDPVTPATEAAEWDLWLAKLQENNVTLGPATGTVPAPIVSIPTAASTGLVVNPGFEDDGAAVGSPAGWQTWTGPGTNDNADYTETYAGAHSGTYHGAHYSTDAYEIYTYQTIRNLLSGTYVVRAWVKSSGGQTQAQMRIKSYGGPDVVVDAPATPDGQWVQIALPNLAVTTGQCEIGFYSKAAGGQWLFFDDVELVRQAGAGVSLATGAATPPAGAVSPTLYPNPADGQVTVAVNFAQATTITLVIKNLQGTPVARYKRPAVAGSNQFTISTANLPSGIYALQIQSSQPTLVQRLEVRH